MKKLTRAETAGFLQEKDNFLLLTHCRPDGDTLGSAAALCRMLRKMGKAASVLENPELTPRYAHLLAGLTCPEVPTGATVVSVDVAASRMFPKNFAGKVALRLDHHGRGESFAEYELVEENAGACGEVIFALGNLLGVALNTEIADALYTAVSTDTGCFRFANTTADSFAVASACAAAGSKIYEMNQAYFETVSLGRLRLQGKLIDTVRLFENGKYALCAIPHSWEQEMGLTEDDMENISNFPRTIEGVKMAATLRENQDGSCKLSVRAVPGYDASCVCAVFGGGGHKGAAGASIALPLSEAEKAVEQAMLGAGQ